MASSDASSNRARLTKGRVDRFTCPPSKSQAFLWDTAVPGLALRVTRGGARAYVFQARLHGRTVRHTIGSPDAWDIDGARGEARRLRVLVDSGVHPADEKRDQELAAAAERRERLHKAITLADVWPEYVAARSRHWSQRHKRDHDKAMQVPGEKRKRSPKLTVAGPLYPLRDERLAELTAERLSRWLVRESRRRPTVTAHSYRLLRACLIWVSEQPAYRGLVEPHALFSSAVRRAVPKSRPKTDVLQREQLALWFDAVRAIHNPVIAAYLQALLLTGTRREEMARLRWRDVDFTWRSLTIRDKVEGEREIPLTPYLAHLLSALPKRNKWVFSSLTAAAGRLTDANHAHTRALRAAGLPHVTLHGLRRSFGTLSEWVEAPVGVVAQIQGHKPSALAEKHYRRRPLDLLRQWHMKIESWILGQAGIAFSETGEAPRLKVVK